MSNNVRNFLVTGGAGFIGSSFVAKCAERGDKVIVLDALTYAGCTENLSWIPHKHNYELIIGNITDRTKVLTLLRQYDIDVIINFAAESHVDNSINSPGIFLETNIIGTYTLLEAARTYYSSLHGSKKDDFLFLQVSTDEVYGALSSDDPKFNENSPFRPNSPYSATKAAADHLIRAWHHTYDLPVVTSHCGNNYGPRQHPEKLIPNTIACALQGKKIPIYGNGRNIRDWIYVDDHCHGLLLAIDHSYKGTDYCFSGHSEIDNLSLVRTICSLLDDLCPLGKGRTYDALISFVNDRPGHDFRYAIDDSKARSELGYHNQYNLASGLQATIKWYLDNSNWLHNQVLNTDIKRARV